VLGRSLLRHKNEGPIHQVQLLQDALGLQCTKECPLTVTASKIRSAISRAFEMVTLTEDLFTCIALLNSLTVFPHLRSLITRDLSESTPSMPYSSSKIFALLENEQRILDADTKRTTSGEAIALTSQSRSRRRPIPTCSNCKKSGHTAAYCISEGGGMAGKTIDESRDARRADQNRQHGYASTIQPPLRRFHRAHPSFATS